MKVKYAALITAAGLSRRMGEFKPLIKLGDHTFLEHVLLRFLQAGVTEACIVTGYKAEKLQEYLKKEKCSENYAQNKQNRLNDINISFVYNPGHENNEMFDSIRLGISHLKDRCENLFITPADIPFFKSSTLKAEMNTDSPVVIPEYNGRGGHPILVRSSVFDAVLTHDGTQGLKGAFKALADPPSRIPVDDPGCTMDADTPEDLKILKGHPGLQL